MSGNMIEILLKCFGCVIEKTPPKYVLLRGTGRKDGRRQGTMMKNNR